MTFILVRNSFLNSFIKCINKDNYKIPYNHFCNEMYTNSNLKLPSDKLIPREVKSSVLDICNEDVSDYAPNLAPTFNIAAYANKSYTIQEFVKLGVNLNNIENKGLAELILKCDFDRDVKKYIQFLNDVGVPPSEYGHFFTVNPLILREDLDNLAIRVNYLTSKKFLPENIVRILSKNPKWISYSTVDIDKRLGFFQQHFHLSGDQVRQVAVRMPKIITYELRHIETIKFTFVEEMGFTQSESKELLLVKPKVFTLSRNSVQKRLDFILNTMNVPHSQIVTQSSVLLSRLGRIQQRHNYLQLLKKNQYDCHKPCYISLEALVRGTDVEFCENVAFTSIATYNAYLKTL